MSNPETRTEERPPERCPGCYDSFSGPWCDNCDQWPCFCLSENRVRAATPEADTDGES